MKNTNLIESAQLEPLLKNIPAWSLAGKSIERTFAFKDFAGALVFVNMVGEIAESAGHHPDIGIRWNKVNLSLFTHSKGGLTELDFQLAARIDALAG